jgi:hypothetical protein
MQRTTAQCRKLRFLAPILAGLFTSLLGMGRPWAAPDLSLADICQRSPAVVTALLRAVGRSRCQDVRPTDLGAVRQLEVSWRGQSPRSGDLVGLSRLDSLTLLELGGDFGPGTGAAQLLGTELQSLTALQSLRIHLDRQSPWPETWSGALAGATGLRRLVLVGSGSWTDFGAHRLGSLRLLRSLTIEVDSIARIDEASFSGSVDLEQIEISSKVGSWEQQPLRPLSRLRQVGGSSTKPLSVVRADPCSFDSPSGATQSGIEFQQRSVELWNCQSRRSVAARAPNATSFSPFFLEGLDWSQVTQLELELGSDQLISQFVSMQDTWGRYIKNVSNLTLRLKGDTDVDFSLLPGLTQLRNLSFHLPPRGSTPCWQIRTRIQQIYGFSSRTPWVSCQ